MEWKNCDTCARAESEREREGLQVKKGVKLISIIVISNMSHIYCFKNKPFIITCVAFFAAVVCAYR